MVYGESIEKDRGELSKEGSFSASINDMKVSKGHLGLQFEGMCDYSLIMNESWYYTRKTKQ